MQLCVIEGDGIGREVIPAAITILRQVLPDIVIHQRSAGWQTFEETGLSLHPETLEIARQCQAVLYGAVTSPSYPVEGYFSPIVRLRQQLQTHANIRPTRYLPVPTARDGVDLLVVRENTEDIYVVEEQSSADGESSTATKVITRAASERIAQTAYELARQGGRQKVTIIHKANVLPKTDGLFRQVALEISKAYDDIETEDLLVDTAAYWMVKDPERFDVLLTLNQYGDILSDMAAAWGGGLGLAPALNLGGQIAIAEPVHGSAPDIAGKGIANPTAIVLSTAMLIRYHWGLHTVANRIEKAIYRTLQAGYYTADLGAEKSVSTEKYIDRVLENL